MISIKLSDAIHSLARTSANRLNSLAGKFDGPEKVICGMCYRSIEDHKEYPTQYCYEALQIKIKPTRYNRTKDGHWISK